MKRIGCLIGALFLLFTINAESDPTITLLKQANTVKRIHADSAISLTHKALALASTDSLKARAYYTLGNTYLLHDQYDISIKQYKYIPKLTKDILLLGKVYNNMGVAYKSIAQYDSSIIYYFKSLILKEKDQRASPFHNIGVVYRIIGDYKNATKYCEKSLLLFTSQKDTSGIAKVMNGLGNVYSEKEQYNNALNYYFKYISLLSPTNFNKVCIAYSNIGLTYERMNQLDSAYIYSSKALTINREIDDRVGVMIDLNNLAYILQRQEKYEEALSLFKESMLIANSLNKPAELEKIYFNMLDIYGILRDDKNELVYYELFSWVRENINSQDVLDLLEEEEAKYAQLELQREQERTRKKRTKEWAIYGVVICSVVMGIFMVLRWRKRKLKSLKKD